MPSASSTDDISIHQGIRASLTIARCLRCVVILISAAEVYDHDVRMNKGPDCILCNLEHSTPCASQQMTDQYDISVVLSTYNRCTLLPNAIESILNQNAKDLSYEIILVDNNSTDNTKELIARYSNNNSNLK